MRATLQFDIEAVGGVRRGGCRGRSATLTVVVFLAQLLLALGPATVKDDIYYTIARQCLAPGSAEADNILEHFSDKNELFLADFVDGAALRNVRMFVFMLFHLHCTPHTAFVTGPSLMLLSGLLVALVLRYRPRLFLLSTAVLRWIDRVNAHPRIVIAISALFLAGTSAFLARGIIRNLSRVAEAATARPVLPIAVSRPLWVLVGIGCMGLVVAPPGQAATNAVQSLLLQGSLLPAPSSLAFLVHLRNYSDTTNQ